MLEPSAIWTDVPELVVMMLVQCFVSVVLRWWPVAPLLEIYIA